LISDVQNVRADFNVILVYDVSRWGRFQDTDESAYYEFICKVAGIKVLRGTLHPRPKMVTLERLSSHRSKPRFPGCNQDDRGQRARSRLLRSAFIIHFAVKAELVGEKPSANR
jgi:hypothetical protein